MVSQLQEAQINPPFVYVNKILLGHSHTYLLKDCPGWLFLHNCRVECMRVCKPEIFTLWSFTEKFYWLPAIRIKCAGVRGYIKHLIDWPKWKLFLSSSELQSHMYFCCTIYHRITEFLHAVASYRLESLFKPAYWVSIWPPLGICLVCLVDVICFLVR